MCVKSVYSCFIQNKVKTYKTIGAAAAPLPFLSHMRRTKDRRRDRDGEGRVGLVRVRVRVPRIYGSSALTALIFSDSGSMSLSSTSLCSVPSSECQHNTVHEGRKTIAHKRNRKRTYTKNTRTRTRTHKAGQLTLYKEDEVFEARVEVRVGAQSRELGQVRVVKMRVSEKKEASASPVTVLRCVCVCVCVCVACGVCVYVHISGGRRQAYTLNRRLNMFFTMASKSLGKGTPILEGKIVSSSSCFCTHWKRWST